MQTLWQDLRHGARLLAKKPGFTLVAVITLSLGIGATTTIFTLVNAVLLRPLPYPDAERLMEVGRAFGSDRAVSDLSPMKFAFLRDNQQSFAALTATQEMGPNTYLSAESKTEYMRGLIVSGDFFRVLGVSPAFGRGFTAEESSPGGERVAILGHGIWRERFNADAGMIGRTIALNGVAWTVVGIMPAGFDFFGPQDVIVPMRANAENEGHNWRIIGRLRQEITDDQARAEMKLLFDKFRTARPQSVREGEIFSAVKWQTNMTSSVRDLLWILLGAVGCLLLIACANIANLQLARSAARQKEMAIRKALGASGSRLIRQLLTEGVVLSLAGGLAGLLLAIWGLDAVLALVPAGLIPRASEISLDLRVLAFASGVSLLSGIISGLAPALQALRADVSRGLKEGTARAGAGVLRGRLRSTLLVVEVALALVLASGAGLLLRTFANLRGVEPGFEAAGVLTLEVGPRGGNYDSLQRIDDLYRRALERLGSLPGVEAAALTSRLPLDSRFNLPYRLAGHERLTGSAEYRLITPDYFRVLKIAVRQGRPFDEGDRAGAEPVIIVNEAFARANFASAEPLGEQLCAGCEYGDPQMRRIIGVVGETKQRSLGEAPPPTVFISVGQATEGMREIWRGASIVLRTSGDPLRLAAAVRREIEQIDSSLPIRNLRPLEELLSRSVAPQRFNLSLLGSFAGLGLLLAAVGIYGVTSYSVSQRTDEIGLRMALGARAGDVLQMILKQGMRLALLGVAVGLAASFALTRLMRGLLFGVSAHDPATFAAIALLIGAAAFIACYLPAQRATKVDPMVALRYE